MDLTPFKIRYLDLRMGFKCNPQNVLCVPTIPPAMGKKKKKKKKDWLDVYPTIENKDLKQTMGWDNKGKQHGANYNWHKDNPKILGSTI